MFALLYFGKFWYSNSCKKYGDEILEIDFFHKRPAKIGPFGTLHFFVGLNLIWPQLYNDTKHAVVVTEVAGLVTPQDRNLVIDKAKLSRFRDKVRSSLNSRADEHFLYFDGRQDKTLFTKRHFDGIVRKSLCKGEHVSLIEQLGDHFLQYVSLHEVCAFNFLHGITNVFDQDL